jgi:sugar lactone lactonase YvrE
MSAAFAPSGDPLQFTSAKTLVDVQGGLKFTMNPHWFDRALLFVDIHDRRILSADLDGELKTVTTLPFLPGSFNVHDDGRPIVSDAWRRKIYQCDSTGQSLFADLSNFARICLNAGVFDRRGGMYFGDVGFDYLDPTVDPVPSGLIVHVNARGESSVVAGDLFSPHGMIITPDNETLIVAETLGHRLTAFEIEQDGTLCNRRVWAQFQADIRPDGICLDLEGAVWVAGNSPTALRVREGGEVEHQVVSKRSVFDMTLGGPEQRHLFLCTSTACDPVITRRHPDATIDVAEVNIPGV